METTLSKRTITYNKEGFSNDELIAIYRAILKPRLIEEKMLILLRQGKISKWFSGWGQEGISVGAAYAMKQEEFILPMHRNLGVFTTRGIPLNRLFAQFQGKMSGFTKGRDRSFHFGAKDYNIVGMISHLGPQLGIADGIALANKLKKNEQATIVFTGDGGASEGDFHESLNVAANLLKDTGIKTKIIKQYLPIINKLVNKYLASFDFFVNFNLDESFKETIKSRHRDDFTYASLS